MTKQPDTQSTVSPAEFVIGKIGGLTKTAKALGLRVSTVQGWKIRGRIPQEHWLPLIAAAESGGQKISLSDFLHEHEETAA